MLRGEMVDSHWRHEMYKERKMLWQTKLCLNFSCFEIATFGSDGSFVEFSHQLKEVFTFNWLLYRCAIKSWVVGVQHLTHYKSCNAQSSYSWTGRAATVRLQPTGTRGEERNRGPKAAGKICEWIQMFLFDEKYTRDIASNNLKQNVKK